MSMGGVIRALRNNLGLSQRLLAEKSGLPVARIRVLEGRGRAKGNVELEKIAEALETDRVTLQSMSEMYQILDLPPNFNEDD